MNTPRSSSLSRALGAFLLLFALQSFALMAPPESLETRVSKAEKIFGFKLLSIEQKGAFKIAELEVVDPIHKTEKGDKVKVCWTGFIEQQGFVPEVGDTGIAVLVDQHEGAYWFRADKVEPLEKKAEIVKLLAKK